MPTITCPICEGKGMSPGKITNELTQCWACDGRGNNKLTKQRVELIKLLQEADEAQMPLTE